MVIDIQMPALSPTMEEGTLSKWLVKEGDLVKSGDLLAEIETDKATMEFEAIDEGTIAKIMVPEGTDSVKVGTVIAVIAQEGEDLSVVSAPKSEVKVEEASKIRTAAPQADPIPVSKSEGGRMKVSPLARRLAEQKGVDLASLTGSGPTGRIVKADIDGAEPGAAAETPAKAQEAVPAAAPAAAVLALAPAARQDFGSPYEAVKLSNMRKTIARRLTEAKQTVPHIYLTVDIQLDKLLKLREELNAALSAQGVKLSVNDLLIKALAASLMQVPECNVQFAGDTLLQFSRADISVAVSIPGGLITPIVTNANIKGVGAIATEMKDLAARAKDGKLKPEEYQGGTASLSNMGMFGIRQFAAVINPPQAMIMAIGAGEKRPYIVEDALGVASVMSATASFDHRAVDGADGARLMQAFKSFVEAPMGLLA